MSALLLNPNMGKRALVFDPRTKLLLLATMAVFVLGGLGRVQMENLRLALSVVLVFFLLFSMKWRATFILTFLFSIWYRFFRFRLSAASSILW